jgi:hypothetical protein
MIKKLYEFRPAEIMEPITKKKRVPEEDSGDYFLITWHEGGDEIHFLMMDMIHYETVDKSISELLRRDDPKVKKWSEIISDKQNFAENFLRFCYKSQTYPKGRNKDFWLQSYCSDKWIYNDYNIERIIYIPEFGQ